MKNTEERPVTTYTDKEIFPRLSATDLLERAALSKARLDRWVVSESASVDEKIRQASMDIVSRHIHENKNYYLVTYTFPECFSYEYEQMEEHCFQIRNKHIQLFDINFRSKRTSLKKPEWFPRQWFFIEGKHARFHIHVLLEAIDKSVFVKHIANKDRTKHVFKRLIEDKLFKRKMKVITDEMAAVHRDYHHHQHYGKTYDQLQVDDHWLIARFLVEYIMHRNEIGNEKWGLHGVNQSPISNHSKVMNDVEALCKVEYLHKKEFYKKGSPICGQSLCYQYSDIN